LIRCDYCGGDDLSFAWRREFTVVAHGWEGVHEYWWCRVCGSGAFVVKVNNEAKMSLARLGENACWTNVT